MNPYEMTKAEVEEKAEATRLKPQAIKIAIDVLVNGMTYQDAGDKHGKSKQYVGKIVRRLAKGNDDV